MSGGCARREVIRTAYPNDEGALLELIAEFYEIEGHPFVIDTVAAGLAPLLESDTYGVVLVADDGDERGRFYRRLGFEVEDSVWMLADIGWGT